MFLDFDILFFSSNSYSLLPSFSALGDPSSVAYSLSSGLESSALPCDFVELSVVGCLILVVEGSPQPADGLVLLFVAPPTALSPVALIIY